MKIKLSPSQVQKTILAPTMQQSIEVLLLPVTDLSAAIEQELQENPLLEIENGTNTSEICHLEDLVTRNINRIKTQQEASSYDTSSDDESHEDKPITRFTPLEEYLLEQLRLELTDPRELLIGELIIGHLNEDGYFTSNCEEIAQLLNIENVAEIEEILNIIQNFEPIGIASRNLKECLLTQVDSRFNGHAEAIREIIESHLESLGKRKHIEIARKLKLPLEEVKSLCKKISTLEPRPARKFRPINQNIYIKPDVTVYKDEDNNLQILINNESIPQLRISRTYQAMLKQPNRTPEELEFIRSKIKAAIQFIKSIEQRHSTIKGIANYILSHQKEFFEKGHLYLKPMILKDVAAVVSRNESTVCRAINNKYMDTPQGLLPMKFFFSQAVLNNDDETSVSSRSIKEEIKEFINGENSDKPFTDQEIYHYLSKKGMKVARRTISKYRQTMKILPSHLRKI